MGNLAGKVHRAVASRPRLCLTPSQLSPHRAKELGAGCVGCMGWDAALAPTACLGHLPLPLQPEDVRAERPSLAHQPCPGSLGPEPGGQQVTESEPLAGDERRPAAADTRCHLPGLCGQEPGCPCSRGQIPVRRRQCGLSEHPAQAVPCQELPAHQAAEEPHGPTSPCRSFPG